MNNGVGSTGLRRCIGRHLDKHPRSDVSNAKR
jgi:hypothetical protein